MVRKKLVLCLIIVFCTPHTQLMAQSEPIVQLSDTSATPPVKPMPLTLAEAIALSITQNRNLMIQYVDRRAQRFANKIARETFQPQPFLDATGNYTRSETTLGDEAVVTESESGSVTPSINFLTPLGTRLTTSWTQYDDKTSAFGSEQSFSASFTQPLMEGFGARLNRIPIQISDRNEIRNRLNLRNSVMSTVTQVISAYRNLYLAKGQLEINRLSLERSKKLVEVNRALIDAGRMARQELVQAEADVAGREISLAVTENAFDAARIGLISLLNLPANIDIIPTELVDQPLPELDIQQLLAIAYQNRPDYLSQLLSIEDAKAQVVTAQDQHMWSLNLTGSIESDGLDTDQNNASVGLSFSMNFDRDQTQLGLIQADNGLWQSQLALEELEDSIEREIVNALRNIRILYKQLGLARKARALSLKQLQIEREKLKLGRSSNFQIVSFEDNLIEQQNNELSALVTYLDALTSLDLSLGKTLETWQVNISDRQLEKYLRQFDQKYADELEYELDYKLADEVSS